MSRVYGTATGFESTTNQFISGHLASLVKGCVFVYELSSCKFKCCWSQKKTPKKTRNTKINDTISCKVSPNFSKFCSSKNFLYQRNLSSVIFFSKYSYSQMQISLTYQLKIFRLQAWITPDLIMYCNIILNESVKDKKHFFQYILFTLLFAIKYYLFDKKMSCIC